MVDTNYIISSIKILESPVKRILDNNTIITKFRAQFPQTRSTRIIDVVFWGNLAQDVSNRYKVNDYIIIEGYLSIRTKKTLYSSVQNSKKIEVTALRVHPFSLNSGNLINKT